MKQKIAFIFLMLAAASCVVGILYLDKYTSQYDSLLIAKEWAISGANNNHDYEYFPNFGGIIATYCLIFNGIMAGWQGLVSIIIYYKKTETILLKVQSYIISIIAVLSFLLCLSAFLGDTLNKINEIENLKTEILNIKNAKKQ
jgi:uncharacterized membrane protein